MNAENLTPASTLINYSPFHPYDVGKLFLDIFYLNNIQRKFRQPHRIAEQGKKLFGGKVPFDCKNKTSILTPTFCK